MCRWFYDNNHIDGETLNADSAPALIEKVAWGIAAKLARGAGHQDLASWLQRIAGAKYTGKFAHATSSM